MQRVWVLYFCALAAGAGPLLALGNTTDSGTGATDSPAADTPTAGAPAPDASSTNTPAVETPVTDSLQSSRGRRAGKTQRQRHSRGTITDTQNVMGRTQAVWVELEAALERRGGVAGRLVTALKDLREDKKRLMDQGEEEEEKKKKKEEEEEEDEDDEDEDEDDEDEDDDEEEEEEEEEEEGEEEEAEEEATDSPANSTVSRNGFTDSLPERCQLGDGLISCKGIGMTRLPIITDLGVTALYLPGNNISTIPLRGFSGLPNLEQLDLSSNQLDDSSLSPHLFSNLTKLKRLNLDGNGLTVVPWLPPSLEELTINDNKITHLVPHSFKGLSSLLSLELEANRLYEDSVSPLTFEPLKMVVYLRLDKNRFRSLPLGLPSSLQDLRLRNNQLQEVQDGVLDKSVHLRVLDLSHNLLREEYISSNAWMNLPMLEALDLSYNHLALVPAYLPSALRQLSLQNNEIEGIPGYVLSHLRPGLQSLRLSHNRLGDDGVKGLSFRGVFRSLVELLLDNNRLESVPRSMRVFKNLQLLRLDHNRIRSVGLYSVCKRSASERSPLASLHLEHNLIEPQKIPPAALSCIQDVRSVVLEPQSLAGSATSPA